MTTYKNFFPNTDLQTFYMERGLEVDFAQKYDFKSMDEIINFMNNLTYESLYCN